MAENKSLFKWSINGWKALKSFFWALIAQVLGVLLLLGPEALLGNWAQVTLGSILVGLIRSAENYIKNRNI